MSKRRIRFGIIGLGMMGREFASAAARWMHLLDVDFEPVITGICDTNPALFDWFTSNFESIEVCTTDYQTLLGSSSIDAIYCAVPHNLHQQFYIDIVRAGKHLLGEKPFGIDQAANAAILETLCEHPDTLVCCSSEFPFFPGAQRVIKHIFDHSFGTILEVEAGFLHSSDIDPRKPINWKRIIETNGEYGCMGDLGLHVTHVPLRAGWKPRNVRAVLSNVVRERPTQEGRVVPCLTWDNATIFCEVASADQNPFPMTLKTFRIAPGETNTWYIRVHGTQQSVRFSTRQPKSFYTMSYSSGSAQTWNEESLGYVSAYPTITGGIFEFGFPDSILQMWAAFCDELVNGRDGMRQPFYCATPDETAIHHEVLTAALTSHLTGQTIHLQ